MSVNSTNEVGETALHYACIFGNLDIITYLIKNGADPNTKTLTGDTALLYAVTKGHLHVVKYFMNNTKTFNLNINHQNDLGETAILIACKKGYTDLIKYLVNMDVDLHSKSSDGCNLLHYVVCGNNLEIVKLITERMNLDSIL